MPAHVETVVIFLPDVWTCRPTSLEWQTLAAEYKKQLDSKLSTEEFKTKAESTFFVMPFFRIVCDCFVRVGCYCLFFDMFKESLCLVSIVLLCLLCECCYVMQFCCCPGYLCLFRLLLLVLVSSHFGCVVLVALCLLYTGCCYSSYLLLLGPYLNSGYTTCKCCM